MELTLPTGAGEVVAHATGRLDLRSAPDLRARASAALAAGGGVLVLDLTAIEFIDSSGLGVLVGLHKEALRLGGRLVIVRPAGSARQIFALTRTESFFALADTVEDARAALSA